MFPLSYARVRAHTGCEINAHRKLKCAQQINSKKYGNKTNMVVN